MEIIDFEFISAAASLSIYRWRRSDNPL